MEKKTNQSRAYAKSVIKLFHNKLKGNSYLNNYALSNMLHTFPNLLSHHFIQTKTNWWEIFTKSIKDMLYDKFLANFSLFKQTPDAFLNDISQEISTTMQERAQEKEEEYVDIEQLRNTTLRFLEIGINKLVWSPQDNYKTWESVKTIANQLVQLMEHNIIVDADDLDDLFWSLIHRYCDFLDLTSAHLTTDFFKKVKRDIAENPSILLELEEQEQFVRKKSDHLKHALLTAEAKNRAYERGIFVGR